MTFNSELYDVMLTRRRRDVIAEAQLLRQKEEKQVGTRVTIWTHARRRDVS